MQIQMLGKKKFAQKQDAKTKNKDIKLREDPTKQKQKQKKPFK